jgi:hypothetical protein
MKQPPFFVLAVGHTGQHIPGTFSGFWQSDLHRRVDCVTTPAWNEWGQMLFLNELQFINHVNWRDCSQYDFFK